MSSMNDANQNHDSEGNEYSRDTVWEKWGEAADAGFVPLPNILLRAQAKLGLSPTCMVVLLNIMMHWWKSDRLPFPRSAAIAKRSGLSVRTVQRSIQEMEERGLIKRIRSQRLGPAAYDLSPLKKVLIAHAREDVWRRPKNVRQKSNQIQTGERGGPHLDAQ